MKEYIKAAKWFIKGVRNNKSNIMDTKVMKVSKSPSKYPSKK